MLLKKPLNKDNLWLWGHEPNSHQVHNLPESFITPLEACHYMGISNLIMVNFNGLPQPPYQFPMGLNSVVWSATGAGGEKTNLKEVLKLPISGLMFDDFFSCVNGKSVNPVMTLEELKEIKLPKWLTLYIGQDYSSVKDYIDAFDVLTFWNWHPENLIYLDTFNIEYRQDCYLGLYMYDYSANKPLPIHTMKKQCEIGLKWLMQGKIKGLIFLASCICDLNLDAVKWTRKWIN